MSSIYLDENTQFILLWVLVQFITHLFTGKKHINSLFPPPRLHIFSGCGWKTQCPPKAGHRHLLWLMHPELLRFSWSERTGLTQVDRDSGNKAVMDYRVLRCPSLRITVSKSRLQLRSRKIDVLFHAISSWEIRKSTKIKGKNASVIWLDVSFSLMMQYSLATILKKF